MVHPDEADFDRIWISPITKQIDDTTAYGQAFHGYWQQDLYSLNPHFGTFSDLLSLSQALHARGMALMVDVVVNHFGSPYQVNYSSYTPFNDGSYFHEEAFITDYSNQAMVEQGWLGNGEVPLPDIDTENPQVVSTFNAWISDLVQTYQIDGLRLDTVKHVRKDFWPGFVAAGGVFALGEVLSGDPNYLSAYQPYTGGLLDYGTYYPLLRAFTPGGNMNEVVSLTAPSYRALFTDTQLLATFMENHDMPRFPAAASSDVIIVQNAMAYTLLSDGIPVIYYGQEQSFSGGADPNNREAMWASGFKITTLYTYLAKLNRARSLAWSAGFGTNLTTGVYVDPSTSVTQKGPLLLVLSNQGSSAGNKTVSFPTQFASGTILYKCHNRLRRAASLFTARLGTTDVHEHTESRGLELGHVKDHEHVHIIHKSSRKVRLEEFPSNL
ncbi:putative Alpha-amylase [Taphrina deformans PYCC 5710]|uniref:Alpha-amylase n=1 Tax=Taphrina deformans (strain PYCC 5710 / ATCC 11124 / CBS 356.35 / IMI 108563 / JCM 9778 / NBRC 8474) TaxID=1097556 RepID=R4XIX6_TAPDE|nr:putative Alpha-amylase [Taphrina deformans PYCC 5710]|eukprot:CCG83318.1 putative Alpha-amylase [Taphrina deformans PYCC 5710]